MKTKLRITFFFLGLIIFLLGASSNYLFGREIRFSTIQIGAMIFGFIIIIISIMKSFFEFLLNDYFFEIRFVHEILIFLSILFVLIGLNYSIINNGSIAFDGVSYFLIFIGILSNWLLISNYLVNSRSAKLNQSGKPQQKHNNFSYHPEIDGLRALAVISVILYHLQIVGFGGGFVGVDVFFVISGFLITRVIYSEIVSNSFSIVSFYERRIRRIFPALFCVLLFVAVTGYFLFDPDTFTDLGKTLFSTTFFTSNFMFWHQIGYFDKPSELKPLLHTWSLAVEEQFYIFFPILFLFIWRISKKYFREIIAFIALLSFLLSAVWVSRAPSTAFYLLPFRAWELLLGSILCTGIIPSRKEKALNIFLGLLGLVMILISVLTFSAETTFPGIAALVPTLGTFLIIYTSNEHETISGSLLSWKPLVFIGKISYSLYLWHWVFIVIARYYNILPLTTWQTLSIGLATLTISSVCWYFIEMPFRKSRFINQKYVFVSSVIGTLILGAFGLLLTLSHGLSERFNTLPEYYTNWSGDNNKLEECVKKQYDISYIKISKPTTNEAYDLVSKNICDLGSVNAQASYAVIGDSHSQAISYGIDILSKFYGLHGILLYTSACPFTLDISSNQENNCNLFNVMKVKYLKEHPDIKMVIMAGRWGWYVNGTPYSYESKNSDIYLSYEGKPESLNYSANKEVLKYGLDKIISELLINKIQVILINEIPEVGYFVPTVFSIAKRTGRDINQLIAPTLGEYNLRNQPMFDIINNLKIKYPSLLVINPSNILCNDSICIIEKDGFPIYRDGDHLNAYGSLIIADQFKNLFINLVSK